MPVRGRSWPHCIRCSRKRWPYAGTSIRRVACSIRSWPGSSPMPRFNRRGLLIGGGALAAAGVGTILARPAMQGGLHNPYFARLSKALRDANLMRPTLVIDRTRLDANIAAIRASTQAARLPLREIGRAHV